MSADGRLAEGHRIRIMAAVLAVLAVFASLAMLFFPSIGGVPDAVARHGASCTTFMASDGYLVLLGDSEDEGMDHPLAGNPAASYAFFRTGNATEYGRMHLGWLWQGEHDSFQAGMNDHGLAYALTAVPDTPMAPHPERPFRHGRESFYDWILRKAATVDEAIAEVLRFDFASCWFQIQFADALGNSAILSPGSDGEFVITSRLPGDLMLVASTFNRAEPDRYVGRDSFRRSEQAEAALGQALAEQLTVLSFTEALRAVDRQGPYAFNRSYTVYSTVYDLTNLEATLYVLSLYDLPIHLDLLEELSQGDHRVALRDLIPSNALGAATRKYWATQVGGFAAVGVPVAGFLVALALGIRQLVRRRRERRAP